ncbi:MAG TPA: GAF domain-containing sensor histidine kinase [Acidobacteriaceae bacterium]
MSSIALPANPYTDILSKTAQLLLKDSDPDTLCQEVFEQLREPLEVDVYFNFMVSSDGTYLELASSGGNKAVRDAMGSPLAFGAAVCGRVAQTCRGMYVTGVQDREDDMTELIRSFGIRCYACNPILIREKIIGTLSFGSRRRDSYNSEELEVFRLVVQQVTLATERRLQNERLRHLEQLAAAGRMTATLAHEINNPLESLVNLLHLLQYEVHSEGGSDLLGKAQEQVNRLAETTQNTLRAFRGHHQPMVPVDLSTLASELVEDIRLPQHTRLHSEIERDLCVKAVSGELRQVLLNLLINAGNYTPPGKEVTLTIRRNGDHAVISVKDEGLGISPEIRARLFQPFYTTRGHGGTGLGLWLSREMVQRFGGTLTFESDPDLRPGTEFIVRLPLIH